MLTIENFAGRHPCFAGHPSRPPERRESTSRDRADGDRDRLLALFFTFVWLLVSGCSLAGIRGICQRGVHVLSRAVCSASVPQQGRRIPGSTTRTCWDPDTGAGRTEGAVKERKRKSQRFPLGRLHQVLDDARAVGQAALASTTRTPSSLACCSATNQGCPRKATDTRKSLTNQAER
jgi:hypothetical protein